jgi:hypothetical protein
MRKKSINVDELTALLIAKLNMSAERQMALQAKINAATGFVPNNTAQISLEARKMYYDWMAELLASRLKRNRHNTPLISAKDFDKFLPVIFHAIELQNQEILDDDSRIFTKKVIKSIFENVIVNSMQAIVPDSQDPYDFFWTWVKTAIEIAGENNVRPAEVFTVLEAQDEITRRTLAKDEYVLLNKKWSDNFINIDFIRKILIDPMIDAFPDSDEEERQELRNDIESDLIPLCLEMLGKIRIVVDDWNKEEVARIYG